MALEHDVHVVGVSTMAAGHRVLVPRVVEALRGALLPWSSGASCRNRIEPLHAAGVSAVFGPGSTLPDVARVLLGECEGARSEVASRSRGGVLLIFIFCVQEREGHNAIVTASTGSAPAASRSN